MLKGSLKIQVLQDPETADEAFSSIGFMVKQEKSFLFLTQLTAFPGACLQTISAKACLPQEHFSGSGKTGQAITDRSCHHVEDTSGSSEPYGTLHLCSLHVKAVHASLPMSDSENRPSPQGCDCFLLLSPLWFWLDHLQHPSCCQGTQWCLPICLER